MTCWTGSSSSSRAGRAVALVLTSLVACASARPAGAPAASGGGARAFRVAVLPADSLSSGPVPLRAVTTQVERAMEAAGLKVVGGDAVEAYLENHRLRFTGGVDGPAAAAARGELGVDGLLITTVEEHELEGPPRLAITFRLVSASEDARILWTDGFGRAGDDAPGLLGLGVVRDYRRLEARELVRMARSLTLALDGRGPRAPPCPAEGRFEPSVLYRSPDFQPAGRYSVAVLPFVNETSRRRAGDLLALELTRQLAGIGRLRVIEPGVTRDRLIHYRVIMEGGVSLDTARVTLETVGADLVIAGYVRELSEGADPSLEYTALALDRSGKMVWQATSHGNGSAGVWFFDWSMIGSASQLACRLARGSAVSLFGEGDTGGTEVALPAKGGKQ